MEKLELKASLGKELLFGSLFLSNSKKFIRLTADCYRIELKVFHSEIQNDPEAIRTNSKFITDLFARNLMLFKKL